MTSSRDEINSLCALAPLFVKGLLSDSERGRFERSLADTPELTAEVERWKKIDEGYKKLECELPSPSSGAYSKIAGRISMINRKSFFERFMPSPALSFAVIAIQFLIMTPLIVYVATFRAEYRTLSAPSAIQERPVRINVVFKREVTESAIRELLLKVDGKIVDGPFRSGLYVIGIGREDDLPGVLRTLRDSELVTVVEKAY